MKINLDKIKRNVQFIKEEIILNIYSVNLMSESEQLKFFRNIESTLDRFNLDLEEELGKEISKTYYAELATALALTGVNKKELNNHMDSFVHHNALNNILTDTFEDLRSAIRTAKATSNYSIRNALDLAKHDIAQGILYGNNRRTITERVARSFNENGLKAFYTVDGKVLPLDFYSETVVNTKLRSARTQAHATHYERFGVDLFTVHGRYDTCSECAAYRDVVFSMNGNDERFPHLDPKIHIPFHPNCKCLIRPYIINYKEDDEIERMKKQSENFNPEIDKRTAEQRKAYEKDQENKRRAREELKQYQVYKSVFGDDAPKTLGAFRRMKRKNTKNYRALKARLNERTRGENRRNEKI